MTPVSPTTIRLTKENREAIEVIANELRERGVFGLFNNDGEINVAAVIRYSIQHLYMEVKSEQKQRKKTRPSEE